ncbi:hypothetical protein Bbelb_374020 [Branchiostoma belcheri]|nr:hypothetical protein Bbelb_427610 [Branchiostoma belcheri]KAI8484805.1 hypothetical protein Bbelb_374020 [Branchiostoma belcheri]
MAWRQYSPTVLPCLYLIKRAWNRPNSSNSCGVRLQYYIDRESSNGKNTHSCINTAFDSVDRQCLWKVLTILGVPSKLLDLLSLLYSDTTSCVLANGQTSDSFTINSGVRQGCVLAPTIFKTAIDHVMANTVSQSSCGASFGNVTISDLDYVDDVAILAEVVQEEVVNKFNYLGSTITSDCKSTADIRIRVGRAATAMANLSKIWSDRRLSVHTKLRLYNSLVLSILLYGAEAWTLTSTQDRQLDAFDAKCLRRILGIRWYDCATNIALRRRFELLASDSSATSPDHLRPQTTAGTHTYKLDPTQRQAQTEVAGCPVIRPESSRPQPNYSLGSGAEQKCLEDSLPGRYAPRSMRT